MTVTPSINPSAWKTPWRAQGFWRRRWRRWWQHRSARGGARISGVTRRGAEISLGLHKARDAEVVDMQECVLLRPDILRLLPPLRVLLRSLEALRRAGSVVINWLDEGADILLRMDAAFTGPDRTKIIAFARAHDVLRISIATGTDEPEPAIMLAPPVITFAGVKIEPPPGAFLQASAEGEAAIVAAVLAGLPKLTSKSRIVELFAGSGTLVIRAGAACPCGSL